MSAITGVVGAIAVVLGVEIVIVMTTDATTHLLPGGLTLFGVVGAIGLVRVAKAIAAVGVQQPAPEPDDDE